MGYDHQNAKDVEVIHLFACCFVNDLTLGYTEHIPSSYRPGWSQESVLLQTKQNNGLPRYLELIGSEPSSISHGTYVESRKPKKNQTKPLRDKKYIRSFP